MSLVLPPPPGGVATAASPPRCATAPWQRAAIDSAAPACFPSKLIPAWVSLLSRGERAAGLLEVVGGCRELSGAVFWADCILIKCHRHCPPAVRPYFFLFFLNIYIFISLQNALSFTHLTSLFILVHRVSLQHQTEILSWEWDISFFYAHYRFNYQQLESFRSFTFILYYF